MKRQLPIWTSFVAVLCMATFSTARDAANRGTDRNPENLATRCIERINNLSQTASTNSNGLCERSIKGIEEADTPTQERRIAARCIHRLIAQNHRATRAISQVARRCGRALRGHSELRAKVLAAGRKAVRTARQSVRGSLRKIHNAAPRRNPADRPSKRPEGKVDPPSKPPVTKVHPPIKRPDGKVHPPIKRPGGKVHPPSQ